jgi:hypothetical protein
MWAVAQDKDCIEKIFVLSLKQRGEMRTSKRRQSLTHTRAHTHTHTHTYMQYVEVLRQTKYQFGYGLPNRTEPKASSNRGCRFGFGKLQLAEW